MASICALQVDAGRRSRWITPGITRRYSIHFFSTRYRVEKWGCLKRVESRHCEGDFLDSLLSTSDAFRRQPIVYKKYCVTSNNNMFLQTKHNSGVRAWREPCPYATACHAREYRNHTVHPHKMPPGIISDGCTGMARHPSP
jgi:hypothetical protein